MAQIILNEEQTKLLWNSRGPVEICDPKGKVLASVPPLIDTALIELAKERAKSPGPWYSGQAIQERLLALQQAWDREGAFDEARMREILDELRVKRAVGVIS